ncbi:MAG: hypothetical protein Q9181_004930 [Wetmoreana brouardii]
MDKQQLSALTLQLDKTTVLGRREQIVLHQLRAVVPSRGVKLENDQVVNPHGLSLQQSITERRQELKDHFIELKVNSRMTIGLEQPSSMFFYKNQLVPAESCYIGARLQSRIDYAQTTFGLEFELPAMRMTIAIFWSELRGQDTSAFVQGHPGTADDQEEQEDFDELALREYYTRLVRASQERAKRPRSGKHKRPNCKNMSLVARYLELLDQTSHDAAALMR